MTSKTGKETKNAELETKTVDLETKNAELEKKLEEANFVLHSAQEKIDELTEKLQETEKEVKEIENFEVKKEYVLKGNNSVKCEVLGIYPAGQQGILKNSLKISINNEICTLPMELVKEMFCEVE